MIYCAKTFYVSGKFKRLKHHNYQYRSIPIRLHPLKIAFCLHHFLPYQVAGTEMYSFQLAHHLAVAGIETLVIIPNMGSSVTDEYTYKGARVIRYAEDSVEDRAMIMGNAAPEGLSLFVDIIKKEKPSIVHFHELAPGRGINIFHVAAVHELGLPIVLTFHLSSYTCTKGSLIYLDKIKCDGIIKIRRCSECVYESKNITGTRAALLTNMAMGLYHAGINPVKLNSSIGTALGYPFVINKIKQDLLKLSMMAEKIVVLAEWYKRILEQNGVSPDKLVYIKQGLTGKEQNKAHPSPGINLPLKVVFIGRISALKGVHLLIDAVCRLPEDKISLCIYGQETEDDYALDCKKRSAGKKNIHWMGMIASEDVIDMLAQHHILCLPSTFSEMSPLVIQEAFAAGLPVLASDVYGNAEQIKEGENGWLFRFKDSDHLAEKLAFLIDDISRVSAARERLPVDNTFITVAEQHVALYAGML